MILYKKEFPLADGVSFSSYIKTLGQKRFPNYYLRIENTASTTNYHATVVFTVPNWEWSLRGPFIDGVLLKECTIQYLEGEKHFTVQASAKAVNFFLALFMVIFAIFLIIFELIMLAANGSISLNDIFIIAIVIAFMAIPSLSIYTQDKNFLDKVGSLGTEIQRMK